MADRSKPRIVVAGVTVLVALVAGSLPAAAHDRDGRDDRRDDRREHQHEHRWNRWGAPPPTEPPAPDPVPEPTPPEPTPPETTTPETTAPETTAPETTAPPSTTPPADDERRDGERDRERDREGERDADRRRDGEKRDHERNGDKRDDKRDGDERRDREWRHHGNRWWGWHQGGGHQRHENGWWQGPRGDRDDDRRDRDERGRDQHDEHDQHDGRDRANHGHDESREPTRRTDQNAELSSIQRANANTGGNHSRVWGAPEPGWWQGPASIRSGRATAIGSQDSTQLDQQAATELTDDATAEIVQIAIVFNIGGAVATTGSNELAAGAGGDGGGAISTGDATAIGNDSETYVTQGAGAEAAPGESEEVSQRVMTLQIGIATSDTGRNTIVASLSSGEAGIATGDATAIGNQSSSTITQEALAAGSGTAHLSIQQRATIVNLGLALANTGSNQVGEMVATALDLDDPDAARRLIELVVPQLIASANTGSGTIDTGDALAIGNRSTTELHQVAVGTADSGEVWIDQNAVVVNAGVASANTGRNAVGAAPLDAEAEAAVAELSTFLTDLLTTVDTWAEGGDANLDASSLTTTVGGVTISIDGSLVPTTGDVDDLATTIRQLTAVINLAAALANSGENTTIVIDEGSAAATAGGDDSSASSMSVGSAVIITGDASATNESVVMVCQLHNIEGVECLAPEEPAADAETDPGPVQPAGAPTHAAGVEWDATTIDAPADAATAPGGNADAADRQTIERQAAVRMPANVPDRLAGPMRQDLTTAHDAATQSLASPSAERPRLAPGDGGDGTPLVAVFGVVALSGALAALVIVRRRLV